MDNSILLYRNKASAYLKLCKIKVSLFAAFSAASGSILAAAHIQVTLLHVFAGVFFLACGASGINQYQERATDALMPRTRKRPLPAGQITPEYALGFSFLLAGSGITILSIWCGITAAVLGLLAVVWYDGVYILLKRVSAFAAIPGALTGALPPAIGWTAAAGSISSPVLWALCLFFAIWQVPHFWLLLIRYGSEYETAGLPSLTRLLGRGQLLRIIAFWMAATAVSALILCLFGFAQSAVIKVALFGASAWLVWQGICLVGSRGALCRPVFGWINGYMVLVLILISADKLLVPDGVRKFAAAIITALL
jgi:protoheme IX farnesyltransferase